ncbi:hypothetical protein PC113_g3851 [Phytophthora cactorum]|uniref:Uncharacterized protein n=1 Tax=Phytophthora cactorum TaxID=29920 RepID=A0A8T1BLJ1_9STRA|nr:hypothetical protein PC113_g3851 [Phytophthora cactorum]KAG2896449.1 hypothetical protein PC114_g15059 [Phytophthora cactorum]KAG2904485.1 hypothetical protein PC115_g14954 [Phytophthora cactorum]
MIASINIPMLFLNSFCSFHFQILTIRRTSEAMSRRGQRTWYSNYSANEQLLLRSVVETVMPFNRNMWEKTAQLNIAQRNHGWDERDMEERQERASQEITKLEDVNRRAEADSKRRLEAREESARIEWEERD